MEDSKLSEVYANVQKDGINARIKDRDQTLLIWATSEGYEEIALELIAAGADLNCKNEDGNTALIRAACENRLNIAQALVEAGADLDAKNNDGYTAIMLAKRRANMEIYKLLKEAGARMDLETNWGATVHDIEKGGGRKKSLTALRDEALEQKIIKCIILP